MLTSSQTFFFIKHLYFFCKKITLALVIVIFFCFNGYSFGTMFIIVSGDGSLARGFGGFLVWGFGALWVCWFVGLLICCFVGILKKKTQLLIVLE